MDASGDALTRQLTRMAEAQARVEDAAALEAGAAPRPPEPPAPATEPPAEPPPEPPA